MSDEISKLRNQVLELQGLVKRQSTMLAKTGQSVIELQIAQQKTDIRSLDLEKKPNKPVAAEAALSIDTSEFATNGDLEQLVEELQGQLDYLEERSIRRVANNNKRDPADAIGPLPNADGDLPIDLKIPLPETVQEFINIKDLDLCKVAEFYGVLPFPQSDLEAITEGLRNEEDVSIPTFTDATAADQLKKYTKEEMDVIFDTVARYLGLNNRRTKGTW
ncbi:Mrp8 [Kluyveromyces lactis]|nr:Mrp8 [Kluyveromyces lactis]